MRERSGESYEKLARLVFATIVNAHRSETTQVQHDVRLAGRSATHQVDVHWVFEVGGIRYETVVEAKDWHRPVPKEKVLAFLKVLEDLPGQPRGVLVARQGYQKGARRVAEAHGLKLYTLDDMDMSFVDFNEVRLDIADHRVKFDTHWNVAEALKNGAQTADDILVVLKGRSDRVVLHDETQKPVMSVYEAFLRLFPDMTDGPRPIEPTQREYLFDKPLFLRTDKPCLPWARIKGVAGVISVAIKPLPISCFPSIVLEDLVRGEAKMFSPAELRLPPPVGSGI